MLSARFRPSRFSNDSASCSKTIDKNIFMIYSYYTIKKI